jgi:hypothetical protein
MQLPLPVFVTSINPYEAAYVFFLPMKNLYCLDAHIRQLPKKQRPYVYTWLSEDEVEIRQIAFVLINAFKCGHSLRRASGNQKIRGDEPECR